MGDVFLALLLPISIMLIIWALVQLDKLGKLKRLRETDFPQVPSNLFEEWRQMEIKSIHLFEWTVWLFPVYLIVGFFVAVLISKVMKITDDSIGFVILFSIYFLSLLIGFVLASNFGTKAKKIKESAGITWPK
jgi:hypothetical protein